MKKPSIIMLSWIVFIIIISAPPTVVTGKQRAINWWWVGDNPNMDTKPFLDFVTKHKNIVTTIIMRCGIATCIRNESTVRPNVKCLNNNGIGGTIVGNLSTPCKTVIPELTKLGIRTEIWLGEDDALSSSRYLWSHANKTADDLIAITKQYPDIKGFNLDLESGHGNGEEDLQNYIQFLRVINDKMEANGLRFTTDVACYENVAGWDSYNSQCNKLAAPFKSSTASSNTTKTTNNNLKLMNMRTYNGISYEAWYYSQLQPALDVKDNMVVTGLGCWIDHAIANTWSTSAISAEQRICMLMNQSVDEIAMFVLRQGQTNKLLNFPEPFWIPQLEKFMSDETTCEAVIPARTKCPVATVGPKDSWTLGGDPGCCESNDHRGPVEYCNQQCAMKECANAGMYWKPENYSIHPYECCVKKPHK